MVTLDTLNLDIKNTITELKLANDYTVEINSYASINAINQMILGALAASRDESGFYNEMLLEAEFMCGIVELYTNINLDDTTTIDAYDRLSSTGVLDNILAALPEGTYDKLYDYLMSTKYAFEKIERSVVNKIGELAIKLPEALEATSKALENFNFEDYQSVINFAMAANGGESVPGVTVEN